MNIVVLGAGAIGSVFGGLLAKSGHHVALIGRQAHITAIAADGLLIDGIWGDHRVNTMACYCSVAAMPQQVRDDCELALVTVKSYDTDEIMQSSIGLLPAGVHFVSLQNGLDNIESIAAHAGWDRVIGGRVIFGVEFVDNGHVRVTVEADKTALGVPASGTADRGRAEMLSRIFSDAGIQTVVTDDIEQLLWGKMLYNCALNAPATILHTHYGSLLETGMQEVMLGIIREIFAVADCCGVVLPFADPQEYARVLFSELIPRTYDHRPSMLQDILRGKKTEIDALNGSIVERGRAHGCPTPCNSVVTGLVQALELKGCAAPC